MPVQAEKLLLNLAKLETGVARIYRYLSKQDHFTNPVKKSWTTMMNEELIHARYLMKLGEKSKPMTLSG